MLCLIIIIWSLKKVHFYVALYRMNLHCVIIKNIYDRYKGFFLSTTIYNVTEYILSVAVSDI